MKVSEAIEESIRAVICLDGVPDKFEVLRIMYDQLATAKAMEQFHMNYEPEVKDAETV